ncbi:hypothetical protein BDZ90DRAFT_94521 [Jaminaea rosea]|uniref:Uncharacterized protein n=1 Tax=Jaminaea rosea TaxID=1569628 RepID=A0A316UK29_9BASI|nr:hypothetical protein BDZ90DRAFT_94521 [Jaminaea rosea]PWN24721.1 hypothetical protein BDZ90DRAFT_94521 [Jaminaea rosea]
MCLEAQQDRETLLKSGQEKLPFSEAYDVFTSESALEAVVTAAECSFCREDFGGQGKRQRKSHHIACSSKAIEHGLQEGFAALMEKFGCPVFGCDWSPAPVGRDEGVNSTLRESQQHGNRWGRRWRRERWNCRRNSAHSASWMRRRPPPTAAIDFRTTPARAGTSSLATWSIRPRRSWLPGMSWCAARAAAASFPSGSCSRVCTAWDTNSPHAATKM